MLCGERTCYTHRKVWRRISTAGTSSRKRSTRRDDSERVYFHEGDIWWVRLGVNVGFEIDGKHKQFARPVIVLKKYNQYSFLALPLSTGTARQPMARRDR